MEDAVCSFSVTESTHGLYELLLGKNNLVFLQDTLWKCSITFLKSTQIAVLQPFFYYEKVGLKGLW